MDKQTATVILSEEAAVEVQAVIIQSRLILSVQTQHLVTATVTLMLALMLLAHPLLLLLLSTTVIIPITVTQASLILVVVHQILSLLPLVPLCLWLPCHLFILHNQLLLLWLQLRRLRK